MQQVTLDSRNIACVGNVINKLTYESNASKELKSICTFCGIGLFLSVIIRVWHENDHEAKKSRAFVSNNKEVQVAVGQIISIDFKKKLTFQGTLSEPGYVEFSYYIRGSDDNILLVVRGYGEPTKYNVYRIENL